MGVFESSKICKDSHYEKSIAQAAAKVKSFLITYGCEFPGVKKGLSGGARSKRALVGVLGVGEIFQ